MWPAIKSFARRAMPWACMVVGIWWLSSSSASRRTAAAEFPTGSNLPGLALELSDGTHLSLPARADQPARVLVLNFWASYCAPCREEAPIFTSLHERNASQVRVIGLSIEGLSKPLMLRAAEQLGMRYPIAAADATLLQRLRVRALPTTYVIAKDGVITLSRVGAVTQSELEAAIDSAKRRG
jgi:cytochrome c biogenesis protein CcmG, thiol:disulfide interchange protein DsbE